MSASDNLKLAQHYLWCLSNDATVDELEPLFAPDVVQEEFPNRLLPSGAIRDLQAMKEGRERGRSLLKSENYQIVNSIASDDRVSMEVVWTATVRKTVGPFTEGQVLRARFAVFLDFRDGRIARQRNYDCFDPW